MMNEQTLTEYLVERDGYQAEPEDVEADFWDGVEAERHDF